MWRLPCGVLACLLAVAAGCSTPAPRTREFPLTGEVVSLKTNRTGVTVKHEEIPGFMPAMTMPFTVKDPATLAEIDVGDTIAATLVLTDDTSWLAGIRKTGVVPPGRRQTVQPPQVGLAPGGLPPDIVFTADDGRDLPLSSTRGSLVLLTFIYTRCPLPDYCPRMHTYFKGIQDSVLNHARLRGQVRLLSVSFDPGYDTPARLKAQAGQVGANPAVWRFVTAPRAEVDRFGAAFGLTVVREGLDGSTITHNLRTALLGRDGALVKTYNGNEWSPAEAVKDLEAQAALR